MLRPHTSCGACLPQEKEKLYLELKSILARQPGPEAAEQLSLYQVRHMPAAACVLGASSVGRGKLAVLSVQHRLGASRWPECRLCCLAGQPAGQDEADERAGL